MGRVIAYCSPSRSKEQVELHSDLLHGQNAAAVALKDNTYVLVDADGIDLGKDELPKNTARFVLGGCF